MARLLGMYIDRSVLSDYPYRGQFLRFVVDESKPLDEQVEEKVVVFETECDITESSHSWSNNFIWAKYAVYFPYDKDKDTITVQMGDLFESTINGMPVNGNFKEWHTDLVMAAVPSLDEFLYHFIIDTTEANS